MPCRLDFLILSCLLAATLGSRAANGLAAEPETDAVRIDLFEQDLPDRKWPSEPLTNPTETYQESAFGLFHLPWRYVSTGVRAARANPLLLRATASVSMPAGKYRVLVRARGASRLFVDGKEIATTDFPKGPVDGHGAVKAQVAEYGRTRWPAPGMQEKLVELTTTGQPQQFVFEAILGARINKKTEMRQTLGETLIAIAPAGSNEFVLLSPARKVPLTDEAWDAYATERIEFYTRLERERRRAALASEKEYWDARHSAARRYASDHAVEVPPPTKNLQRQNPIDDFVNQRLNGMEHSQTPLTTDLEFLRRATLDLVGTVPSLAEIRQFEADPSPDKRARAIARLLDDSRYADAWMPYWLDVLAENPPLINPTLNNTGPFRWWLYDTLRDNKPWDIAVTELTQLTGSEREGGTAGFGMAAANDAPLAARTSVLVGAFLGVEMKCARCHDAPFHQVKQADLFHLAAMLGREPLAVPKTSVVPPPTGDRKPLVSSSLKPGQKLDPKWTLAAILSPEAAPAVRAGMESDPRAKLAAMITAPSNERFAQVVVNRIWRRLMGRGIVEPAHDWEESKPSHPELLRWLAMQWLAHDYDLKHVVRLIVESHVYQRRAADAEQAGKLFAGPTRRRLSPETTVDALYDAAGKSYETEAMTLDLDGGRDAINSHDLGAPTRAWHFVYLSNDRDRPALSLPRAQAVTELLTAFGWTGDRQQAVTDRRSEPGVLQPALLANGAAAIRLTRLTDESPITSAALDAKDADQLVDGLFLRILTRSPTPSERETFAAPLREGFADRRIQAESSNTPPAPRRTYPYVSWSNHLSPEASRIRLAEEAALRQGPPPTKRLAAKWRERLEDAVWALLNAPEMVIIP